MRISISEINTFLRCRRLWAYTGPHGRNLAPKMESTALILGTGVHEALERFYRDTPVRPPTDYFQEWAAKQLVEWNAQGLLYDEDKFYKMYNLGFNMVSGYTEWYGRRPVDDKDGIEVLCTEQEFMVPISGTDDGWFVGRMDGICRDQAGKVWVLENKTYSSAPKNLMLHTQMLGYSWALSRLVASGSLIGLGLAADDRVMGALYNGLRKQLPSPRVKDPLFIRHWVRHTEPEFVRFEDTLLAIYREMSNPAVSIYPTVSQDCDWCSFLDPCLSVQTGDDDSWILQNSYLVRPSRGAVYDDPVVEGGVGDN